MSISLSIFSKTHQPNLWKSKVLAQGKKDHKEIFEDLRDYSSYCCVLEYFVFCTGLPMKKVLWREKFFGLVRKGMLFKTYEGKINLETFGALKGTSPIAESFDFSVYKSEKDLIKELETVALSGERVNLYFVKRYMTFPWRGDTKYFAIRVERLALSIIQPGPMKKKRPYSLRKSLHMFYYNCTYAVAAEDSSNF